MKLQFKITGQDLKFYVPPVLVADTLNYFSADFDFDPSWKGLEKWAHFCQGEQSCTIALKEDRIAAEEGLNLTAGDWELYVHGEAYAENRIVKRIVTDRVSFSVEKSEATAEGSFPHPELVVNWEPESYDVPRVYLCGEVPQSKKEGELPLELEYRSANKAFISHALLRVQGNSSAAYPKKNYAVRLYCNEERTQSDKHSFRSWEAQNSFVLKADYLDSSHVRNLLGAQLWCDAVNTREYVPQELQSCLTRGSVDGFPVKLYINGHFHGIYNWNIPKEAWMWNMDESNPQHALLCAETNTDGIYSENPCNFRALWSGEDGDYWSIEAGQNNGELTAALNELISCIKDSDDETFKATISQHLDLQSALDYYIHQYVICGVDGLAKNLLLATYDMKTWHCGAYDMDRSFGIAGEGTWASADAACPEAYQEQFSLLWKRLEQLYPMELYERYQELRKKVYSIANVFSKAEYFYDCIRPELYTEERQLWPDSFFGDQLTVQQLREFIVNRLYYCDEQFGILAGKDILYALPKETHFDGTNFIDTGLKLFTEAQDFTIILDVTHDDPTESGRNQNILCSVGRSTAYYGGLDVRTCSWADAKIELLGIPQMGGASFSGEIPSASRVKLAVVFNAGIPNAVRYQLYGSEEMKSGGIWGDYNIPAVHDDSLYIGCYSMVDDGIRNQFFHGTVHDCKVYNRVLSENQLREKLS